ncbi:MAG: RNA polymerase sigma factor [Bacteroidales bacterium]|nr:RNA polymerase sigma factor [Bacteroidales bacterium]
MQRYSDKELIELFQKGDNKNYAFNLLIKKYQKKIYWHIRKIIINHDDADDVTQNTFIKIFKNLNNFRQDSELFTWIYRIATNEAISFLNKKRRRILLPLVDVEQGLINSLKDDPYFNGDELQLKLQEAVLKLPEKQRIIFNMKYFDDMKYEQIAEILKTSVGALKASYHHAVKKIEKYISND